MYCRICDNEHELPDDAVEFGTAKRGAYVLYRFTNGTVHDLRPGNPAMNFRKGLHTRWHRNKKNPKCQYCFPLVEQTELLTEVLDVIADLPEPPQEIPLEPIAVEPNTVMAAAFRRLK